MQRLSVRRDPESFRVFVERLSGPDVIRDDGADSLVAHASQLRDVSATSYRAALTSRGDEDSRSLIVSDVELHQFDPDYAPVRPMRLSIEDRQLQLEVDFEMDDYEGDDRAVAQQVAAALRPMLERQRSKLISVEQDPYVVGPPWLWHVTVAPRTHGRTLENVFDDGDEVAALLAALHDSVALTPDAVMEILRAGRADVLIGQPESNWLDVKRQDYDLGADQGKISLAQDVARFANAEQGGVIVIGMDARKRGGDEIITAVRPIPHLDGGLRRHRRAIDNRVYPPPDGLSVEQVSIDGGILIAVYVPPQPEELKPFLVHGAIVGAKGEGSFISIVRRRGEESIPITAPMIHSALAAGRALLRVERSGAETSEDK